MPSQSIRPSEEDLIARAARHDADAFGALYERYLALIYRYVFYRVDDVAEAEDLTEQVFLKAWEALGHYQKRKVPFSAWLYRIAHNVIVDRHRTRKEILPLEGQLLRDATGGPEDRLDWRETIEAVAYALSQLTPLHRQVLMLRFISGFSHAETARVLERSEEAVRVLQHRALAALRELLDTTMNSEPPHFPTPTPRVVWQGLGHHH
jgi:RNA polymerase sigma-70 factor (ECF subfamily)